MTAPALRGRHSTDPQVLLGNQGDVASDSRAFHPDVLAVAAAEGDVRPYRLRWLQRQYDRYMAGAVCDFDFARVITYADPTGETATNRIDKERA